MAPASRSRLWIAGMLAGLVVAAAIALGAAAQAPATEAAAVPAGLRPGDPIPGELIVRMRGSDHERTVTLPEGTDEVAAIRELERDPDVATASRDYVVGVAGGDDPGQPGRPGGWRQDQWHLLNARGGINAPPAWAHLAAGGHRFGRSGPGKRGPIVAVVDTGVAYRYARGGRFRRSPDLARGLFVRGRDFVDGDHRPFDHFGHGTHMASTIAEGVRNGRGVRGIAPGVRLMPVRVLDQFGFGRTSSVARGIRWAAQHGAKVINTSIEYGSGVDSCKVIPALCRAIREARRSGALVVAASGNSGRLPVPLPARTLVVGAATIRGCLAAYSNRGPDIDLLAPGGGRDADGSGPGCNPKSNKTPGIVQLTVIPRGRRHDRFGYPRVVGTSSAAAHASGVAALAIASGAAGPRPKPLGIIRHLIATGRPAIGLPPNTGSPPLLDAPGAVGAAS